MWLNLYEFAINRDGDRVRHRRRAKLGLCIFNVELNGNELTISGEVKNETEEKGKTVHRIERSYGKFRRVFNLSTDVDPEKVEAQYKNGLLNITVAKAEAAQPKRIEVK